MPRGILVSAFSSAGWRWGGHWAGSPDYQHFSVNGR
ncbi:MAG: M15 family metallopeptidase [Streptosporangiaceae bacterium]